MWPYLSEEWGNPSSSYLFGVRAKNSIARARAQVAQLIGCEPSEIVFTSGATEANNTAIHSALLANPDKRHIVTSQAEHSSVLHLCESLGRRGYQVTLLKIALDGSVDLTDLETAFRPDTAVVSLMWAT
jgi:cysteine desulfurase